MDLDKAYALYEEVRHKYKEKHTVMKGLQILAKYNDDTECWFAHDIMYCCSFIETVKKMTEEDYIMMLELGWGEQEEAWYHF
jgi:hypothetical protein